MAVENMIKSINECLMYNGDDGDNENDDFNFEDVIKKCSTPTLFEPLLCVDGEKRVYSNIT